MEMFEIEERNLFHLLVNLFEAFFEAEKSTLLKEALGEHIFLRYILKKSGKNIETRLLPMN
jgi:hypothetical protein